MGKLSRGKKYRKLYKPKIIEAWRLFKIEQKLKDPKTIRKDFKKANTRKVYKSFSMTNCTDMTEGSG